MTVAKNCTYHSKTDGSWWERDAAGIPLCRVCEKCRTEKLSKFRPEIFRTNSTYAMTGEEVDILDSPNNYKDG